MYCRVSGVRYNGCDVTLLYGMCGVCDVCSEGCHTRYIVDGVHCMVCGVLC